jgi:hypothetical protein
MPFAYVRRKFVEDFRRSIRRAVVPDHEFMVVFEKVLDAIFGDVVIVEE